MAETAPSSRRWLVTGGTGQVGRAIGETPLPANVALFAPGRDILDLADLCDMEEFLKRENITAIINCAAFTAVDRAEQEEELATSINGDAPRMIAEAAVKLDIPLVHLSTDYVFRGDKTEGAYNEEDEVDPINAYGRSKLAGEQAVLASGARAIILRTAWVVSPFGNNFVKTMLRLAATYPRLRVVADQFGNPTSAHDIAGVAVRLLDRLETEAGAADGIFHFVNSGSTSWHGLASRILTDRNDAPPVDAIATSDYPTPAARPANSRLDTARLTQYHGIIPRDWQSAIDEIVMRLERENMDEVMAQ